MNLRFRPDDLGGESSTCPFGNFVPTRLHRRALVAAFEQE